MEKEQRVIIIRDINFHSIIFIELEHLYNSTST